MALQPNPDQPIERNKQPPFLLRLFYRDHSFHAPAEFAVVPPSPSLMTSSLQIYTWPDTTIAELTDLFVSALGDTVLPSPAAGTRLGFRLLFPDTRSVTGPGASDERGRWLSKELGSVVIGDDLSSGGGASANGYGGTKLSGDADKTLADARFVIGDYVSCAILPPRSDGSVAPLPPSERSGGGRDGGGRGGRDRGYGRGGYGGRDGYENGYGNGYGGPRSGGYAGRGGRGGYGGDGYGSSAVPSGDWRRGERLPEGPGYARGRGRGRY